VSGLGGLGRPRLHIVLRGLLRRREDFGRAALGGDLLGRGLREVVRAHSQPLGQFAVAQDADAVAWPLGQPRLAQRRAVHGGAVRERLVEIADVHDEILPRPGGVAEAALGDATEQRHLAAFKDFRRFVGAGTGAVAVAGGGGGVAVAAADAPAHALLAPPLLDAVVNGAQVHYSSTPRSRATSSRVRSCSSPSMVALTTLMALVLPW